MKLYTASSVRVLIRKQGSKTAHITLEDTTLEAVAKYIKNVLRPHVDPFAEGRVTSVTVMYTKRAQEAQEKREPSLTFSFKGLEPSEVKVILCDALMPVETETTS